MKTRVTIAAALLAGMGLSLLAGSAGCDAKPSPPKVGWFRSVKTLDISPSDPDELKSVMDMEYARAIYETRLVVLHSYYLDAGFFHKIVWAYRELENLREAKVFQWRGATVLPAADAPPPPDAPEGVLVERVVGARAMYQRRVEELARYYEQTSQAFKARVIRNMQDRLDPIHTYMYVNSAEYPPLTLRPRDSVPQADAVFYQAEGLFRRGKGLLRTAPTTSYPKQRESLRLFKQLVHRYPSSDKIAYSAYFIAEIYKEYFDEDLRAVNWYERAYTWDPRINLPARFQAATVYDLRLNDKLKAIELYEAAIEHERFNSSNASFAIKRIEELRDDAAWQWQDRRDLGIRR